LTPAAAKLLADERRHLLAIDEAHALPDDSLEDLRLLTIADLDRRSPFLLLLAEQPRLDERCPAHPRARPLEIQGEPMSQLLDRRRGRLATEGLLPRRRCWGA
jgi:type II secretory pathway predicted ATPase ExeA